MKRKYRRVLNIALTLAIAALIAAASLIGFSSLSAKNDAQKVELTKRAVMRAAVSCYALEGFYPASVGYLEEHYGVTIDRGRLVVHYETFGSNIQPTVEVYLMN